MKSAEVINSKTIWSISIFKTDNLTPDFLNLRLYGDFCGAAFLIKRENYIKAFRTVLDTF